MAQSSVVDISSIFSELPEDVFHISFRDIVQENDVNESNIIDSALKEFLVGADIDDVEYFGSNEAAFLVKDFIIEALDSGLESMEYGSGIMLSSGGYPGPINTSPAASVSHNTPGDEDLTETAKEAFPEAGQTNDASVLEFSINVTDPEIDTLRANLVFGSEEYPVYVDSNYVDIAALYVDGNNYANFEATGKPLSIISENLESGVFIDNGEPGDAPYGTEWNGFSKELVVRAPLKQGINNIKIGVADTGDTVLDSGLFISDLSLVSGGGSGNGVLSALKPDGSGEVNATVAAEEITLDDGNNIVTGSAEQLNGDVVVGFTSSDVVNVSQSFFDSSDVMFSNGSVIMDIDTNQDGESDTKLTFAGHSEFEDFEFSQFDEGTSISLKEEEEIEESKPTPELESIVDQNISPVAYDDEIVGRFGWLVSGNLFADNGNGADVDFDGDDIAITAIDGVAVTFDKAIELESGATVTVRENGDLVYDQGAAFEAFTDESAVDTFEYSIEDSEGAPASAVVTVELEEITDSDEFSVLEALYLVAFDRQADAGGLDYWSNAREKGSILSDIADSFFESDEFVSEQGDSLSNEDFLTVLYQNAFDREPDSEGREYWSQALESEQVNQNEVAAYIASSDEMQTKYLAEGFIFA